MKALIALIALSLSLNIYANTTSHAIAMHGITKYQKGFTHFDYVNPTSKKGGLLKLAAQGTFDSLNPYIAKGNAADGLGLIYDSLTSASEDEAFTQYGLVAKNITWPDDRSWVEYELRKDAKFHDGKRISADDIKFTFELLFEKGTPFFKTQYMDIASVSVISDNRIRFNFKHDKNKELILLVGQLPILPKHGINKDTFDSSTLDKPLGSGPYKIKQVDPGKSISYERVKNYWAKDLNINKGKYNFDEIRYDYYRDSTVMLEALKAGEYDLRRENISKQWATAYTGNAIEQKRLIKEEISHQNPQGMQAFVINLRNPLFTDIRVRKALNLAFDFEWTNSTLFYNAYTRSNSFFTNSELSSSGLPSVAELKLLQPLEKYIPATVFSQEYKSPITKGNGRNRKQLIEAKKLLVDSGWHVMDNQLVNAKGDNFEFEILLYDPAFQRVINPYIKALTKLGIKASIRMVEVSQYIHRMRQFEFDIMVASFPQSLSPGNEQIQYWHSSQADVAASRNLIGIKNQAIDNLINTIIESHSRTELVTATKALDRVLLHNYYIIPQWHIGSHRIAYWDKFSKPPVAPKYDANFMGTLLTWSIDPQKTAKLKSPRPNK